MTTTERTQQITASGDAAREYGQIIAESLGLKGQGVTQLNLMIGPTCTIVEATMVVMPDKESNLQELLQRLKSCLSMPKMDATTQSSE